MRIRVHVESKRLVNKLKSAGPALHRKIVQELLTTAHVDIESEAKMTLTVKGHVVTGNLRGSIHVTQNPANDLDIRVGTDVVYAHYIERLDPYLFPAYEAAKGPLRARLKRIVSGI